MVSQIGKPRHPERWVRLGGGNKIRINAQMQLNRSSDKPRAAPCLQCLGLFDFPKPQDADVEGYCSIFSAGRHGKLNMVDVEDRHL